MVVVFLFSAIQRFFPLGRIQKSRYFVEVAFKHHQRVDVVDGLHGLCTVVVAQIVGRNIF
jgi:hypothetical protein